MNGPEIIVWVAGTGWDAVPGTDRRIVLALARHQDVLWIDPPVASLDPRAWLGAAVEQVADRVMRLRVYVSPGVTRPVVRVLTARLLNSQMRATLALNRLNPSAIVVAFPIARFPRSASGTKLLYITDDWIAGAKLMGFSRSLVRSTIEANARQADGIAAVSASMADSVLGRGVAVAILPNGCPEPTVLERPSPRDPVAGLVGQLNERLDLDALEAVQQTGVEIRVIGPRVQTSRSFSRRLNGFLAAPNVTWLGEVRGEHLPSLLTRMSVGLTPYTMSPFNLASFPLKTLEYLGAGMSVVSSDLPATRWLDAPDVSICRSPAEFAAAVASRLESPPDLESETRRRDFARKHSWDARALELLRLLEMRKPEEAHNAAGQVRR